MLLSVGATTCTALIPIVVTKLGPIWTVSAIVCSFAIAIASVSADLSNTTDLLVVLVYILAYLLVRGFEVAMTLEEEEIKGSQRMAPYLRPL